MWQRWNSGTKIFEKSDDNGGLWTALGLDAAIITQGSFGLDRIPVLTKAKQHAQTAYKDEATTFASNLTLNGYNNILTPFGRIRGGFVSVASGATVTLYEHASLYVQSTARIHGGGGGSPGWNFGLTYDINLDGYNDGSAILVKRMGAAAAVVSMAAVSDGAGRAWVTFTNLSAGATVNFQFIVIIQSWVTNLGLTSSYWS